MPHGPRSTPQPAPRPVGPWWMLAGLAGISLGLGGFPAPVLTCLLMVGIGADADLARRSAHLAQTSVGRWASPLRTLHAGLYAWLYTVAWLALRDAASGGAGRVLLLVDLTLSVVLLLGYARVAKRQEQAV